MPNSEAKAAETRVWLDFSLAFNSTLIHSKNLTVFTLNPEGNSQIFLLTPFRDGVNQEKNQISILIC